MLTFSEKYFKGILALFFLLITIWVLSNGIELHNDSEGYIEMSIIRLPLYTLLTQLLYSESISFPLLLFQIGFICFAIYFLIINLKKHLPLHAIWYILLSVVLLLPCLTGIHIANSVLSEAIAYPLYLLNFTMLALAFFTQDTKYVKRSVPLIFLLLLTRSQFIYLFPVLLLLLFWIAKKRGTILKNIWLFLGILALPLVVSLTDKTYHKIVHDHFVSTPWSGIHLLSPAVYVSKESDATIFKDKVERDFFEKIYAKLMERKLNIHHPGIVNINQTDYYKTKYTRIANWTLYDFGKNVLGEELSKNEKFIKLDRVTKHMALPLIWQNKYEWLKLNFQNFINGFRHPLVFVFYLVLLVLSFLLLLKKKNTLLQFIFLGSLLTIANIATVAIGIHTIKRFTFYNDWIFFAILFVIIHLSWRFVFSSEKN